MKKCYKCGIKYPLFMYHKDRRKFQLKFNQGKVSACRFCAAKEVLTGSIIRFNFTTNKFEIIKVKPNWLNWLKVFIGWK